MKRKIKIVSLFMTFLIAINYGQNLYGKEVTDKEPSQWTKQYIEMSYQAGLIPEGIELNYQEAISREVFCALIVKTYEKLSRKTLPTTDIIPFTDYNSENINKVYTKGILKGKTKLYFMPDDNISRQEMMIILIRVIDYLEEDLNIKILNRDTVTNSYDNYNQVENWSKNSVDLAIANDLYQGTNNELPNPKGAITVEEIVVLLAKIACMVNASQHNYYLENGNYITNGRWLKCNYKGQLLQDNTFNNLSEADDNLALKKNGTLFVLNNVIYYEYGNCIESKCQQFDLKCITGIHKVDYSSTFIATCLDGSVWECNSTNLTYKEITFPEPIKVVQSNDSALIALSYTGNIYFGNIFYKDEFQAYKVDDTNNYTKISCNKNTFRAVDKNGTIFEWHQKSDSSEIDINSTKEVDIPLEQLDYYNNFPNIDLKGLPTEHKFCEIDDRSYFGCFALDEQGNIYLNDSSNEFYDLVKLSSIKMVSGSTFLDENGCIWKYGRLGRAGGYAWDKEPTLVPGMTNGVIIDDGLSLLDDGSIWCWQNYSNIIEHMIGKLPEGTNAYDFVKILHYKAFIYLIDNQGNLWRIEDYETKSKDKTGKHIASIYMKNVKDMEEGFILNQDGLLSRMDDNGELYPVLESVQEITQGYALTKDNKVAVIGAVYNYEEPECFVLSVPFIIEGLDNISNIGGFGYIGFAEDSENNMYYFRVSYDDQSIGEIIKAKVVINDYKKLFFNLPHIIIQRDNGTFWVWSTYLTIDRWLSDSTDIKLDHGFKLLNAS